MWCMNGYQKHLYDKSDFKLTTYTTFYITPERVLNIKYVQIIELLNCISHVHLTQHKVYTTKNHHLIYNTLPIIININ